MGLLKRLLGSTPAKAAPGSAPPVHGVRATLFSGRDALEVKGESFYQENLRRVVAELGPEVAAILLPEPNNQYDHNAVGVWVGGLKVGHLSREDSAIYQPAITQLMKQMGTPIAVRGQIFGGEPDKPSLGIWLYHDPPDFGIALQADPNEESPGSPVRTGASAAGGRWRESLSGDRLTAIKQLRASLETETNPVDRHFLLNTLEEYLYACRDVFTSALTEFEATCELHHSEMTLIRPALMAEFKGLPMLPTYRQMAIMKQKAGLYADALAWAERGLDLYGGDCIRDDAVADLRKRIDKLRARVG